MQPEYFCNFSLVSFKSLESNQMVE